MLGYGVLSLVVGVQFCVMPTIRITVSMLYADDSMLTVMRIALKQEWFKAHAVFRRAKYGYVYKTRCACEGASSESHDKVERNVLR